MPNDREREILEQFSVRQAKGEALNTLGWWKIDKNEMAYMKAIPTKDLCTRCHGTEIDPSLQQKIVHFYPDDDKATGFNTGQIRGTFTLKKTLGQYDGKTPK